MQWKSCDLEDFTYGSQWLHIYWSKFFLSFSIAAPGTLLPRIQILFEYRRNIVVADASRMEGNIWSSINTHLKWWVSGCAFQMPYTSQAIWQAFFMFYGASQRLGPLWYAFWAMQTIWLKRQLGRRGAEGVPVPLCGCGHCVDFFRGIAHRRITSRRHSQGPFKYHSGFCIFWKYGISLDTAGFAWEKLDSLGLLLKSLMSCIFTGFLCLSDTCWNSRVSMSLATRISWLSHMYESC